MTRRRIIYGDATESAWREAGIPRWRRRLNDRIAIFRAVRHPKWSDSHLRGRVLRRVQLLLRGEWR